MRRLILMLMVVHASVGRADVGDVTFRVRDRLAADEVEELTGLYVDGQLIRSFHLAENDPDITITVTVAGPGAHEYGLCGHLRLKAPDGGVTERVVDATGTIADVGGREFEAVASDDFTRFFLIDTTTSRIPTVITPHRDHACAPAVS